YVRAMERQIPLWSAGQSRLGTGKFVASGLAGYSTLARSKRHRITDTFGSFGREPGKPWAAPTFYAGSFGTNRSGQFGWSSRVTFAELLCGCSRPARCSASDNASGGSAGDGKSLGTLAVSFEYLCRRIDNPFQFSHFNRSPAQTQPWLEFTSR